VTSFSGSSDSGERAPHPEAEDARVEEERGEQARLSFGPVQLLGIAFDGNHFKGEILPELERLKVSGVVRVIDLLFVRKDSTGAIATLTASDLDWEEATRYGEYIGTLVGFGAGGAEGAERGAMAGAAELADGHVFTSDDAFRLANTIPEGMSMAIALIEHLWALPLLDAIHRADGIELTNEWVKLEELVSIGLRAAEGDLPSSDL
jgi:uncharacterized membrane protein